MRPRLGNWSGCPGRSAKGCAGEAGEEKLLRKASGQAENAKRRESESDVEKNGMEEPLEEAAANARRNVSVRKETE